jgi:hypothetical protein
MCCAPLLWKERLRCVDGNGMCFKACIQFCLWSPVLRSSYNSFLALYLEYLSQAYADVLGRVKVKNQGHHVLLSLSLPIDTVAATVYTQVFSTFFEDSTYGY